MRPLWSIFLVWLLAVSSTPAWAQQAIDISGRWLVQYHDRELGFVPGEVLIDREESSAMLTVVHPVTEERYELSSRSFVRNGDRLKIEFDGRSPTPEDYRRNAFGQDIAVPPQSERVPLRLGNAEGEIQILPHEPGREQSFTVELRILSKHVISGRWSFEVEPDSGRDRRGGGRLGQFELLEDGSGGARQWGTEAWLRPKPAIMWSIPVSDQLDRTHEDITHPYPFDDLGPGVGQPDTRDRHRFLMVVGVNLPRDYQDWVDLRSLNPRINYRVRAYPEDLAASDRYALDIADGWEQLKKRLAKQPDVYEKARELEVMLVRAELSPGVVSGLQGFTLNGEEAVWNLQFGDFRANAYVTRDLSSPAQTETEPTEYVYLPETIRFEIRADRKLPHESIPLLIGKNFKMLLLDGERSIPAYRDRSDPLVYRTDPIHLIERGATAVEGPIGYSIRAAPGDEIYAMLAKPGLVQMLPAIPRAKVVRTPSHVSADKRGDPAASGRLWKEALATAARCAEQPVEDWSRLSAQEAERIKRYIIANAFNDRDITLSVPVSVGDHAMLLMMKDALLDELAASERRHREMLEDDERLKAFRLQIAAFATSGAPIFQLPLSRPPGAPEGPPEILAVTFMPKLLEERYGLRGEAAESWVLEATREAIRQHLVQMAEGREAAREKFEDECGVKTLLGFVAVGFQSILPYARERLMNLEDVPAANRASGLRQSWRPDEGARLYLARILDIAQQVQVNDNRANNENIRIVSGASLGLSVLGGAGAFIAQRVGSMALAALSVAMAKSAIALEALLIGAVVLEEVRSQQEQDVELEFARGAFSVLGFERLSFAQMRQTSWFTSVFRIYWEVAQLGAGEGLGRVVVPALLRGVVRTTRATVSAAKWATRHARGLFTSRYTWPKIGESESIVRGQQMAVELPPVSSDDLPLSADLEDALREAVEELSPQERLDLARAITDSRTIGARGGTSIYTAAERQVAEAADALEAVWPDPAGQGATAAGAGSTRQNWMARLEPETVARLRGLELRDDVYRLFQEQPVGMAGLVEQDDALNVLRGQFYFDFEDYFNTVTRFRQRAPPAQGPRFYESTGRRHGDPNGVRIEGDERLIVDTDEEKMVSLDLYTGAPENVGNATRQVCIRPNGDKELDLLAQHLDPPPRVDPDTYNPIDSPAPANPGAPRFVDTAVPLVPGRGTPTSIYLNLRAMIAMGIEFADRSLKKVTLKSVFNAQTAMHIHALRRGNPHISLDEAAEHSFLVRFARSMLEQAGFRIDSVEVRVRGTNSRYSAQYLIDEWYAGRESPASFLRRYNIRPDEQIEAAFDIVLNVRPISRPWDPGDVANTIRLHTPPSSRLSDERLRTMAEFFGELAVSRGSADTQRQLLANMGFEQEIHPNQLMRITGMNAEELRAQLERHLRLNQRATDEQIETALDNYFDQVGPFAPRDVAHETRLPGDINFPLPPPRGLSPGFTEAPTVVDRPRGSQGCSTSTINPPPTPDGTSVINPPPQ